MRGLLSESNQRIDKGIKFMILQAKMETNCISIKKRCLMHCNDHDKSLHNVVLIGIESALRLSQDYLCEYHCKI